MGGVISGGQSITMNYEQGMSSDSYSTTIDGEYFEGKAVMVDATTTFGSAFGSAYSAYGATSLNTSGFAFSSSGKDARGKKAIKELLSMQSGDVSVSSAENQ